MVVNGIFRRSFDCFACNVNHDANQFMHWGSNACCTCAQYFCRWLSRDAFRWIDLIVIFMANFGSRIQWLWLEAFDVAQNLWVVQNG